MANPFQISSPASTIYRDKDFLHKYRLIDDAIRHDDLPYLRAHLKQTLPGPVNLSEDPLLSVLIACHKTQLALSLLPDVSFAELTAANFDGDTALHVAAAEGDLVVAMALVERHEALLGVRNKMQEIPLHKAALYGERGIFWELVRRGSPCDARREDGATVLHCAVMGNAPKLALEIATCYPELMLSRNSKAVTPLQLVVTIPHAFRSKLHLGLLESLIYEWIPIEESTYTRRKGDEEELEKPSVLGFNCGTILSHMNFRYLANEKNQNSDSRVGATIGSGDLHFVTRYGSKFPPNYATLCNLLTIMCIPARWFRLLTFRILKQLSSRVEQLEQQKINHRQAMKLIEHLAADLGYWDFIVMGRTGADGSMPLLHSDPEGKRRHDSENAENKRWDESPLTLGTKMGLDEFVEQILRVCPQAAKYLDLEGRNVLQVAIQHGQEKIVRIIESMATGTNPVLPSWLLSSIDAKTKNTILHFAAEVTVEEEARSLQMQHELQWFEWVRKLVPKDLEHSRNDSEKTARELFTEKHKAMIKSGKEQLLEMGKTCSGLVAAVVFASSFSIPGQDSSNNSALLHKTAFEVFTHAYVIGLSCAATALVLFVSLLTSPYREQDFRRSLPTKYFFANMSFFIALVALLMAFSCNIYLNIYGGRKAETKDIVSLVCELTIFPAVCFLVLLYRGSTFGLASFLTHVWR